MRALYTVDPAEDGIEVVLINFFGVFPEGIRFVPRMLEFGLRGHHDKQALERLRTVQNEILSR
jgi:hypothetical protein